ncbi:MAG: hypothetical protein LBB45_08085 [Methanobrevibacter sp.]|nr:hypothetical protein [Candidatus Methanovirga basalitermitum]
MNFKKILISCLIAFVICSAITGINGSKVTVPQEKISEVSGIPMFDGSSSYQGITTYGFYDNINNTKYKYYNLYVQFNQKYIALPALMNECSITSWKQSRVILPENFYTTIDGTIHTNSDWSDSCIDLRLNTTVYRLKIISFTTDDEYKYLSSKPKIFEF